MKTMTHELHACRQQRLLAARDAWEFACRLYTRPGVEAACQDLQNRRHLDPVWLLALCWQAVREAGVVESARIAQLDQMLQGWREQVIIPLRRLQLRLEHDAHASLPAHRLRRALLDTELYGKRLALQWLAQQLYADKRATSTAHQDAMQSLLNYWHLRHTFPTSSDDQRSLHCVVHYLA